MTKVRLTIHFFSPSLSVANTVPRPARVQYTPHNPLGAGLLCSKCTSEGIEDIAAGAFKKPAAAKAKLKKKAVKVVEDHHTRVVKPLLQSVLEVRRVACFCDRKFRGRRELMSVRFGRVQVIGKQIENVDALGDIGSKNLDRIAKIVCKARALSGSNLHLFLDAAHTELRLYDCTSTFYPFDFVCFAVRLLMV